MQSWLQAGSELVHFVNAVPPALQPSRVGRTRCRPPQQQLACHSRRSVPPRACCSRPRLRSRRPCLHRGGLACRPRACPRPRAGCCAMHGRWRRRRLCSSWRRVRHCGSGGCNVSVLLNVGHGVCGAEDMEGCCAGGSRPPSARPSVAPTPKGAHVLHHICWLGWCIRTSGNGLSPWDACDLCALHRGCPADLLRVLCRGDEPGPLLPYSRRGLGTDRARQSVSI
jgi:hypothetical protein